MVPIMVLVLGGPLVELHLPLVNLALATLGLVLMATEVGLLALAAGAATGRRALARLGVVRETGGHGRSRRSRGP